MTFGVGFRRHRLQLSPHIATGTPALGTIATGTPAFRLVSARPLARSERPHSSGRPQRGRPEADLSKDPRRPGADCPGYQGRSPRDQTPRGETPEDRDPYGIRAVRNRHDDPEIPESVQAKDLD